MRGMHNRVGRARLDRGLGLDLGIEGARELVDQSRRAPPKRGRRANKAARGRSRRSGTRRARPTVGPRRARQAKGGRSAGGGTETGPANNAKAGRLRRGTRPSPRTSKSRKRNTPSVACRWEHAGAEGSVGIFTCSSSPATYYMSRQVRSDKKGDAQQRWPPVTRLPPRNRFVPMCSLLNRPMNATDADQKPMDWAGACLRAPRNAPSDVGH